MTATPSTAPTVDDVAQRMFEALLGALDLFAVYLGDRLGWYACLADSGPLTPDELAERTATSPRYAREWLEQQAVTGLLDVTGDRPRTFALGAAAREVFTDVHSLNYLAPLGRMLVSASGQAPALLEAYRSGGGVGWARYGPDAFEAQADMNRPWYEHRLAAALRSVPDVHDRLSRPGAVIADVGCGGAWSTIALARAYPDAVLRGFDVDAATVALAQANVAASDVADRVTVTRADMAAHQVGELDAAFAFECVHDMSAPVEVLAQIRRMLRPGAPLIVMDEAVRDEFTAPGDEVERLMYGFSLGVCLPDGMSHTPSAGTGTVMRPATLRAYALQAGFSDMSILPIEEFGFWRFYRLT